MAQRTVEKRAVDKGAQNSPSQGSGPLHAPRRTSQARFILAAEAMALCERFVRDWAELNMQEETETPKGLTMADPCLSR